MTQTLHDILFAHWPIDAALVAPKIPAPLELDMFDHSAWLGIIPFRATNVAPRDMPALPWLSEFPQLNVRTYVRVGDKAGVYFFSLDTANPLVVLVASKLFGLPYHTASMQVSRRGEVIRYRSRRTARGSPRAELLASYRPTGPVFQTSQGSLDYFLTERYVLFMVDRKSRAYEVEVHHPPWPLQPAEAEMPVNTMSEAFGIPRRGVAPLLHFAKRQDMVAWWMAPAAR